jgi:hypothetical protein
VLLLSWGWWVGGSSTFGSSAPQTAVHSPLPICSGHQSRVRSLDLGVPFADVAEVKLEEMNGAKARQIGVSQYIRVDRPGSPVEFSTSGARYELAYTIEDTGSGTTS